MKKFTKLRYTYSSDTKLDLILGISALTDATDWVCVWNDASKDGLVYVNKGKLLFIVKFLEADVK